MPPTNLQKRILYAASLAVVLALAWIAGSGLQARAAQATYPPLLVPIGGGFNPVALGGFYQAAFQRATGNQVNLLVLPVGLGARYNQVSDTERRDHMRMAESRRQQLEQLCQQAAGDRLRCKASLAPILIRLDAENIPLQDYFTPDLTGIMILSSNPSTAMQALIGTPVEQALDLAYRQGTVISATSPSTVMLATTMLSGYMPDYDVNNTLEFGAVDVWNTPERRGLSFGVRGAILEQQFFERGRLGRLLNAISQHDTPHVGVGVDSNTSLWITGDEKISPVFGEYITAVLDAQTYHAADGVQYVGAQNWISLRNVLFHLLAPGDSSYDLNTRQHSLVAPPERVERRYNGLVLPANAGPLLLTSNLALNPDSDEMLNRFTNWSGGAAARLLVVAAGFPNQEQALEATNRFKSDLIPPSQSLLIDANSSTPVTVAPDITGIILIGGDASLINTDSLVGVAEAWRSGLPLLAENAGATVAGQFYAAYPPTPENAIQAKAITQDSLLVGSAPLKTGMGLVNLNITPQVQENNRWGQWIALAYNYPSRLAIGIPDGAALEITRDGAGVLGNDGLYVLDLSLATLAQGQNILGGGRGMVVANGLLDVFGPGERLTPSHADSSFLPVRAPTPAQQPLPLAAQPSAPPGALQAVATQVIPTATRVVRTQIVRTASTTQFVRPDPSPTNPRLLNMMIITGSMVALSVLLALWINRQRANLR